MTDPVWQALFERHGVPTEVQGGALCVDPFTYMAAAARRYEATMPPTAVSVLLSAASEDYSRARVSVTITCPCPSTEAAVAFTTEAAFILAKRMVNQAAVALDIPPLGCST